MIALGISAYYHDSAAAIVRDGEIVAAAQEERFTRVKHDSTFPSNAIRYCLSEAAVHLRSVDHVVFYDKPFLKFERLLETYLAFAPAGFSSFSKAIPIWLKEKLFQRRLLTSELLSLDPGFKPETLLFSEHHLSHAASAFFPSPFTEAVVLTLDGVGEWATSSVAIGRGNKLEVQKEIHFPHSLGLLYSAFTYYAGFKVNSGEYKVMGLAPYGEPRFVQKIFEHLVDLKPDGSFMLEQSYFDYCTGLTMTSNKFHALFGQPPRKSYEPITQFHMDIAASVQAVTEEVVCRMTRALAKEYGIENLCLAGGVALNCVANGKVLREERFKNIWIQPAAGDAGGALGAALVAYYLYNDQPRANPDGVDALRGSYLGPSFTESDIACRLSKIGARFVNYSEKELLSRAAKDLASGKALGWFQGRMEFGPRALGARSILGDPRSPTMQKNLNLKVKFRESFRPFAPAILREDVSDWFEINHDSPYMLMVAPVSKSRRRRMTASENELFGIDKLNILRSEIPAVTHVDYSARIQTVHKETNGLFYNLITKFKEETGCPVLVNTSFNVRGEPIVNTPEDAFRCFMGTDIESLVVGNFYLVKKEQDAELLEDYKQKFTLD